MAKMISDFPGFIADSQLLSDSIGVCLFIEIVMQPVVKLPIIQRVELDFDRIVLFVQLEIQMNTPVTVIRRLSSGQIRHTKRGTI